MQIMDDQTISSLAGIQKRCWGRIREGSLRQQEATERWPGVGILELLQIETTVKEAPGGRQA